MMKRQNGVILNGELAGVRTATIKHGDLAGTAVYATLMTDHITYGGHHQVLFVEAQAQDVLAFWNLTDGKLEVGIEGWLRSTPARHDRPASAVRRSPSQPIARAWSDASARVGCESTAAHSFHKARR